MSTQSIQELYDPFFRQLKLVEEVMCPGEYQIPQVSCSFENPLVGYCPSPKRTFEGPGSEKLNALLGSGGYNMRKGPYRTPYECQCYKLSQEFQRILGLPYYRCATIFMYTSEQFRKRAPERFSRSSLKVGYFLLMDSLHLKLGHPEGEPLPTKVYVPASKTKNKAGVSSGQAWVDIGTRVIDFGKIWGVVRNDIKDALLMPGGFTFKMLQAFIMRYAFGWRDFAARNVMQDPATGDIYQVDCDHFSDIPQNPMGAYIKRLGKAQHAGIVDSFQLYEVAIKTWIKDTVLPCLSSPEVQALVTDQQYECLWFPHKRDHYPSAREFLADVKRRFRFVLAETPSACFYRTLKMTTCVQFQLDPAFMATFTKSMKGVVVAEAPAVVIPPESHRRPREHALLLDSEVQPPPSKRTKLEDGGDWTVEDIWEGLEYQAEMMAFPLV